MATAVLGVKTPREICPMGHTLSKQRIYTEKSTHAITHHHAHFQFHSPTPTLSLSVLFLFDLCSSFGRQVQRENSCEKLQQKWGFKGLLRWVQMCWAKERRRWESICRRANPSQTRWSRSLDPLTIASRPSRPPCDPLRFSLFMGFRFYRLNPLFGSRETQGKGKSTPFGILDLL